MTRLNLIVLAAVAFFGCTTVDPGAVGVEVSLGSINRSVQPPGLYVTVVASVKVMSTQTQTYTMSGAGTEGAANGSVNVLSRDQLPVALDVSVMFHLNGSRAVEVFERFGVSYDDKVVHPLVRTAVRDAASEFIAMDLIDKRVELQTRMAALVRGQLASTLQGRGVNVDAVVIDNILIRNIDLPQTIDDAIASVQRERQATAAARQANLTAEQNAARQLTVANGDAAQLLARTRADAEMLRIKSESQAVANRTIAASITRDLIEYRRVEALSAVLASPATRTVFLPGNASPNLMMSMP